MRKKGHGIEEVENGKWEDKHDESVNLFHVGLAVVN